MRVVNTLIALCIFGISFSQNNKVLEFDFNANLNDQSGNLNNGINNGATFTLDRNQNENSALSFDGENDFVSIPNSLSIKPQFPITISFWTFLNEVEPSNFYCSDYLDYTYVGFWVGITLERQIHVNFGDGGIAGTGSRRSKVSNDLLSLNQWHNIICVIRDFDDMDIFIDCENAGGTYSGSGGTSIVYSNQDARVFGSIAQGFFEPVYLNGRIDDLQIWNDDITNDEVQFQCNNSLYVSENEKDRYLTPFPNPVIDKLVLKSTFKKKKIEIYNMLGKIVFMSVSDLDEIDLSNFKTGIYTMNIQFEDEILANYKLIKE